ncbi:Oidioi.mRNA.OKI2018_I69.chr2.g6694.t1.cds [Oikopleura dioica]|uniref:Oidioi.mRNA.OKI2018_I69.chr2.g6694.t1.cds n=1 Tax=Oikopleura dioica TaxID=34765 RepID=A0ABN7T4H8_OIKDI|nr:Oidioi.mRNA.OKI2018_I69.chr2.g6694.t1.cds [Oikopleura dioica]
MQGFFFDEEDTIQEDIMEDSAFERQMALREFSKEIEKTDEFLKRSSVHTIISSTSRSIKSSPNGSLFELSRPSHCNSRKSMLINDVLADIVKTRRNDENKRRKTTKRMSVMSQSRLSTNFKGSMAEFNLQLD